jgi:hypothetical protein
MNIIVSVNYGKKPPLSMVVTSESPSRAIVDAAKETFRLEGITWQHYWKDTPFTINETELLNALSKAVRSGDAEPLKKRLGRACQLVDDDFVVTLHAVKKASDVPGKAAEPASKGKAKQEPPVGIKLSLFAAARQPCSQAWHGLRYFNFTFQVPDCIGDIIRSAVREFGVRSDSEHLLVEYSQQPSFLMETILNPLMPLCDLSSVRLGRYVSK